MSEKRRRAMMSIASIMMESDPIEWLAQNRHLLDDIKTVLEIAGESMFSASWLSEMPERPGEVFRENHYYWFLAPGENEEPEVVRLIKESDIWEIEGYESLESFLERGWRISSEPISPHPPIPEPEE